MRAGTAARRRPKASSARAARRACGTPDRRPESTARWCASRWRTRTAGCSRRRPRAARRGGAAMPGAPRPGADQRPARRRVRVRASLRARPGSDEGADGAGPGGEDGAGAGLGRRRAPGADALAGGPRTAAGSVARPLPQAFPNIGRPAGGVPALNADKCEPFSFGGAKAGPETVPPPTADRPPPQPAIAARWLDKKPYSASPSAWKLV